MEKITKNHKRNLYKKNPINYKDRNVSHLEMIKHISEVGEVIDGTESRTGYGKIVCELIDEFISVKLPLIKSKKRRKEIRKIIEGLLTRVPLSGIVDTYECSEVVSPHLLQEKKLYCVVSRGNDGYQFYEVTEIGRPTKDTPLAYFQIIADRSKRFKPDINWSSSKDNADYSIAEMEYFLNKNSIKYGGYKNIYAVKYTIPSSTIDMDHSNIETDFVKALSMVGIFPDVFVKAPLYTMQYVADIREAHMGSVEDKYETLNLDESFDVFRTPDEASYQVVVDKITKYCNDTNYDYIGLSIYRLKAPYKDSAIYKAIINALQRGATVHLHIEILARGNERENIAIYKELSLYPNCILSTSYMGYKVHAKFFVASSMMNQEITPFSHISTGNYNEKNALTYADTQLFTNDSKIADSLIDLMYKIQNKVPAILEDDSTITSPLLIRNKILSLILDETEKGDEGRIYIKCNSLCDPIIIRQLYRAAICGVKIRVICRGACSLYKFKNIKIKRILGYNLEHERFYIFGDSVYMSSADLLIRNMDRRVEMFFNVSAVGEKIKNYFELDWSEKSIITFRIPRIQFKINKITKSKKGDGFNEHR